MFYLYYWYGNWRLKNDKRDSKNQTDGYPGLTNVVFSLQYSTKAVKLHGKYIVSDLVLLFQLTDCLIFYQKAQPMFIDIDSQLVMN